MATIWPNRIIEEARMVVQGLKDKDKNCLWSRVTHIEASISSSFSILADETDYRRLCCILPYKSLELIHHEQWISPNIRISRSEVIDVPLNLHAATMSLRALAKLDKSLNQSQTRHVHSREYSLRGAV